MPALRVTVGDLGRRVEIGRGGQGVVYRLPDYRQEAPWPTVYKQYHPEVLAGLNVGALDRVVDVADTLPDGPRDRLLARTAWPTALVTRAGAVCGVLMRQVPRRFTLDITVGGRRSRRPAGAEYLLNPPGYLARLGIRASRRERIALLVDLAGTLRVLHAAGVAIGDLSPRNVLFDPGGPARAFLLDCDTAAVNGVAPLPATDTPDWEAPERGADQPACRADDAYKYALMVVRMLTGDQSKRDPTAPAVRSLGLAELTGRGLAVRPADRPTMAEWYDTLTQLLARWPATSAVGGPKRRSLSLVGASAAALSSLVGLMLAGQAAGDSDRATPASKAYRGIIDVTSVGDDKRTAGVAALLDAYFSALNDNRLDQAIALFDPANRLNPINPERRRAFSAAAAERFHTNIRLLRLSPGRPSQGLLTVDLVYTSAPRAESAIADRRVCWTGSYTLSPVAGGYRIFSIRRSPGGCRASLRTQGRSGYWPPTSATHA